MGTMWSIKYRPKKFEEILGQKHIIEFFKIVLDNYYERQKLLPVGALFGGGSGIGKTTMARVVAASLNCDKRVGVEPCGVCESCYPIIQGLGGVMELDASFFGSIENVRKLRDRLSSYSFVEYQVIILDECHMMSKEAFNGLLKLLEEPPERVFFILVTTETDEVIDTVKSRLLEFRFKPILWAEIEKFLLALLKKEKVTCSVQLCKELYYLSDYNLREVIVSLEQLSVLGKGTVTKELVKEVFGDMMVIRDIIMQLKKGEYEKAMSLFEEFRKFQDDFKLFLKWFVDYLGRLLRQTLKSGSRDSIVYGAMLKCTYVFMSNRFMSNPVMLQGMAVPKLLFNEITELVRRLLQLPSESGVLKPEEVMSILTER